MAKNLNKNAVYRAAKPKDKDYTINDGECLALLVKSNGSKLWRFIYRFGGKLNRLGFGSYPETSLESARQKAEAAREQIANRIDPSTIRKQEKADNQQIADAQKRLDAGLPLINSFEYVVREWLASNAHTVRDITQQKKIRRFELYAFPSIGQKPIGDVKSPDVASPNWRSLINVVLGSLANACSAAEASWKNNGSCSLRNSKLLVDAMMLGAYI